MERRGGETFVSPTDETVPLGDEAAPPPPRFDEKSVQRAQAVAPLSLGARARSWPLSVVMLCVLGGVAGGVLGGLALTQFQRAPAGAETQTAAARQETNGASATATTAAPASPAATESAPQTAPTAADGASAQPAPAQPQPPLSQPAEAQAPDASTREAAPGQEAPAEADAGTQGELRAALGGWLAATNSRDVGRQMSYYAPRVEAFYLSRNATRDAVRAEKARLFERADAVNVEAAPPEIRMSRDGRTAVMRFRKRYHISGADSRSGEVLQELRWRRTDSGWKIVGERDLRVLQ